MFQALLKNYQKKLVNLSGSNRALLLLRLSKENDLDLSETDYLLNKPAFSIIENLVAGKNNFPLCQLLDSRNEKMNLVGRQLQRIARKDHFLFEESGSQDLYVGWPFARGKFTDGTLVHCPLLFFPVSLQLQENTWYLKQRDNEPVVLNKSFLLAWQHYNQAFLPEELVETSFETFSKDSKEFRTALYDLFKNHGLEIHFNSDLFTDRLEPFQQYKSAELAEVTEMGRIKLYNEAVLGIFPQAGSYLIPDYEHLLEKGEFDSLEDFLGDPYSASEGQNHENSGTPHIGLKESDLQTPLPLDAPQEQAIRRIKGGQSIVVQGPPGTGKSQLICNLVSDYISRGKKVLVVCQKRAALDVVYKRLGQIGTGDFVALMHDFKADRNAVYEKIAQQIDQLEAYKKANNSLNTVFLERNYLDACKKIDYLVEELESFKQALFDTQECGISIKELYLTTQSDATVLADTSNYYKYFTYEKLQAFQSQLKHLLPYALAFDAPQYPWKQRNSFKFYTQSDKASLVGSLSTIQQFRLSFAAVLEVLGVNTQQLWQLREHVTLLVELRERAKSEVFYLHFVSFSLSSNAETQLTKRQKRLVQWKHKLNELENKHLAVGVTLDSAFSMQPKVQKAEKLLGGLVGKLQWQWFAKERQEVRALLQVNRLPESQEGIQKLLERIHHSQAFLALKEELQKSRDFVFGDESSPEAYMAEIEEIERALLFSERWIMAKRETFLPIELEELSRERFMKISFELHSAIGKVENAYQSHIAYFNLAHLHDLFDKEIVPLASQELENEFDSIIEYDKARESLAFQEGQVLDLLVLEGHRMAGKTPLEVYEYLYALFDNSIRLAWLNHIEAKYPILRTVSTAKMGLMEQELGHFVSEKQRLSQEILLLKLREQTYQNEEFNRLGNRITYRDLHHQVTKKKKVWPLRKTLEAFHKEAFYVLPCWLASPETVSAVFPMQELFDLVIFDEASQCFAERGIPAMARGKQVVVAGDSKQLPPSDLYRTRFNEDDENVPDTELDSLLDLAGRYMPHVMLTEHYRSRSLDLIDFSNQHFYQHKLMLLPDFGTFQSDHKGIEYVKVGGHLENHCNVAEAEEVVERCMALFQKQPDKEVGVITFNIHQQNLIQDVLEARCIEERRTIPETFIVKNIENIQGDEKDIIFFSIGYAPDRAGRMQHHFGSLNLIGGENRLNVAVTRARDKVIVVTSIYPSQLNVENTLHEGPKLLKKYLEYALNVSEGRFVPTLHKETGFRADWYLKEKLKQRHPNTLRDELPFADLTEKDEQGRLVQLILTDDDKFYRALSVKESFSYLPTTLRKKNWKFERVWSRNR